MNAERNQRTQGTATPLCRWSQNHDQSFPTTDLQLIHHHFATIWQQRPLPHSRRGAFPELDPVLPSLTLPAKYQPRFTKSAQEPFYSALDRMREIRAMDVIDERATGARNTLINYTLKEWSGRTVGLRSQYSRQAETDSGRLHLHTNSDCSES